MVKCNCKYWTPRTDGVAGGNCSLGHLGPTVSYRTCERACEKYEGPEGQPRVVGLPLPQLRPTPPTEPSRSTAAGSNKKKGCGCSRAKRER